MVRDLQLDDELEIQRLGRFNPDRMPDIQIESFENVKHITAAVSPDCSYELVSTALKSAKHELLLYIYNASAQHMLKLLEECRDRGVRVRVMYDPWDTRDGEVDKLNALNVELKVAPSKRPRDVFSVCHQKFAVIDSSVVLVESANWANTSIPYITDGSFKRGNREWLIRIDDTRLASWFSKLFESDWAIPALEGPAAAAFLPQEEPEGLDVLFAAARTPATIFGIGKFPLADGGARVTPIVSPVNYFELAEQLILNAQSSVYIQQQYAVAKGPKTEGLFEALKKVKDKVDIRLMVSPAFRKKDSSDKWNQSYDSAQRYGIGDRMKALSLKYYTHLHNKGLIVDRNKVVVSSTNWSENSIAKAREAGVLVEHPDVAEYFSKVFDFDWDNGIDAADVPQFIASFFQVQQEGDGQSESIHPADLA